VDQLRCLRGLSSAIDDFPSVKQLELSDLDGYKHPAPDGAFHCY
jgi:hypothetical protein